MEILSLPEQHALDPLVESLVRDHPRAHILRAAWSGVRRYIDDAGVPAMHQPEAAALLLAKALAACGLTDDATRVAAATPSAASLNGHLPLTAISNPGLCALAAGALRIMPHSALAAGHVVTIAPERLHQSAEWELDFAAIPALRELMRDALCILDAGSADGLIQLRASRVNSRSPAAVRERRRAIEWMFERLVGHSGHRLMWID